MSEKRGRVHSSTITVAVLSDLEFNSPYQKREADNYNIQWYSGTGCGGQFRNRHLNSARITHIPTGIVRTAQTRSRENSLKNAMEALNSELDSLFEKQKWQASNSIRKDQVGSGQRSDKRRTLRFQDGTVADHINNRRMPISKYMNGNMDELWL